MLTKKYSSFLPAVALKTDDTSPEIDISHAASGEIAIPVGSSITTLTYYVAMPSTTYTGDVVPVVVTAGTYYAAQDATPAAITQTVAAGKAYPLPAALFGANTIQILANAAGPVAINLKS